SDVCSSDLLVPLEPAEHLACALKARRVDELVQDLAVEPHRIRSRARRRAGLRRDRDVVVLGERRDDAALAFVRMADDREDRMTHAAPVSTYTRGSASRPTARAQV